jgi:predicted nucleic-acid-binding Zn-ribbon protein
MHCIKCGSKSPKAKYIPTGESIRPSQIVTTQADYMKQGVIVNLHAIVEKEHLLMECSFCGYTWATDTKDNR